MEAVYTKTESSTSRKIVCKMSRELVRVFVQIFLAEFYSSYFFTEIEKCLLVENVFVISYS